MCNEGYFRNEISGHCERNYFQQWTTNIKYNLKNYISVCPPKTYWKRTNQCKPCPDPNHITNRFPSTNLADCICKPGYIPNNKNGCEAVLCPTNTAPENGYVIGNVDNKINATFEIRCKSGYYLAGSGRRRCLEDGTWSGDSASCHCK